MSAPLVKPLLAFVLVAPPLAWMTFEIGLASLLRPSCELVGHGLGLGWGLAALTICVLAAFVAARLAQRRPADGDTDLAGWLGKVALIGCGVFALAITFQLLATLIVPPCAR